MFVCPMPAQTGIRSRHICSRRMGNKLSPVECSVGTALSYHRTSATHAVPVACFGHYS